MSFSLRLNRSKVADLLIAILALAPAVAIYWKSYSPDAAVYFTYIRNFFHAPFSFQPETVSFGATSPLHVVIHAVLYKVLGSFWLVASKFLNLLFVAFGMVLINRALRGGTRTILLISFFVALSTALLASTLQLFESGLAFFAMALVYHDLVHKNLNRAVLVAGSLYLIRPELIVVSAAVIAFCVIEQQASRTSLIWAGVSILPIMIYHAYMLIAGGVLFPSAMFMPIITYINDPSSWLDRLGITLASLWSASGLIYLVSGAVLLLLLSDWAVSRYNRELLLVAPLVGLYFVFPPQQDIVRYLVPIVPILIAVIVRYAQQELKAQYSAQAAVICIVFAHIFGTAAIASQPYIHPDQLLLKDLSGGLNTMTTGNDRVLLADIQGQYYIDVPCYSATGEVGDQMLDVLLKRRTMQDFLVNGDVKYVVTSDELATRPIFANSVLQELYRDDLSSEVGDTVIIDGVAFHKVMSHPSFTKARVQQASARRAPETTIERKARWNSVYAVIGKADKIKNTGLAAEFGTQDAPAVRDSTHHVDPVDSAVAPTPAVPVDSSTLVRVKASQG